MGDQSLPGSLHEALQILWGGWQHDPVDRQAVGRCTVLTRLPARLLDACSSQCRHVSLQSSRLQGEVLAVPQQGLC